MTPIYRCPNCGELCVRDEVPHHICSIPLVRITAPHFCAGVVVGERAAPVIRYMQAWTVAKIAAYCARKHWHMEQL